MLESVNCNIFLENLPGIIFRDYILKYLKPEDAFNLGLCSRTLNAHVINESFHPLSTALQCLKTTLKYFHNVDSAYDNIAAFHCIEKCGDLACSCGKYRQRKNIVIMDPCLCPSCDEHLFKGVYSKNMIPSNELTLPTRLIETTYFTPCIYHCTLMQEMLELYLCNACLIIGTLCDSCNDMLDK